VFVFIVKKEPLRDVLRKGLPRLPRLERVQFHLASRLAGGLARRRDVNVELEPFIVVPGVTDSKGCSSREDAQEGNSSPVRKPFSTVHCYSPIKSANCHYGRLEYFTLTP